MRRSLQVVDVVFLCSSAVLLLALAALRLLWVPAFALMFQDFGGSLPRVTRLVLSDGYLPVAAMIVLLLGALGAWRRRTSLLVGASVVASAAIAVLLWSMYAPIFELAGNIRP